MNKTCYNNPYTDSLFSSNSMEKLGETFRGKAIDIVQLPEYQGGSLSENKVSDYTDNDNSDKIGKYLFLFILLLFIF